MVVCILENKTCVKIFDLKVNNKLYEEKSIQPSNKQYPNDTILSPGAENQYKVQSAQKQ